MNSLLFHKAVSSTFQQAANNYITEG